MRILILGGTKFIGPHVVRRLAERGHDVTIFHRGETEADLPESVRHVHGDFADFPARKLRALEPDAVLDMVPFVPEDAQRLLAFRGVARRAIAVSSGDVYRAFGRLWRSEPGPPDPVPLTEGSPLRDRVIDPGYDKVGVEHALAGHPDLPVTIVRAPATHGPGDSQHRLYPYLKRMDDRRPAILLDEALAGWHWMRGYVEDVGRAIALAVLDEQAAGQVYNVADPVAYTEAGWVRRIAAVHGWPGEVIAVRDDRLPEPFRWPKLDLRQDMTVDSGRIRRELRYAEVVSEEEALRRTIEWERTHPPAELKPEEWDYDAEDAILATLS